VTRDEKVLPSVPTQTLNQQMLSSQYQQVHVLPFMDQVTTNDKVLPSVPIQAPNQPMLQPQHQQAIYIHEQQISPYGGHNQNIH
jgi:hypothetical protein